MHSEVETPIGTLTIEGDGKEVEVACVPSGEPVAVTVEGRVATFSTERRPPAPMSEITQNGSTFEVLDTRRNGDGYDVLNGNTGVWEKWLED